MTNPGAEDDVAERLREKIIADAFEGGLITSGAFAERLIKEREDAASLIERLQKELKEARGIIRSADEKLAAAGLRSGCFMGCDTPEALADRIEDIRQRTIEECANLADKFAIERWTSDRAFYGKEVCIELAEAIRSIDGGGK